MMIFSSEELLAICLQNFLLGTLTIIEKVGLLSYFDFLLEQLLEFLISFCYSQIEPDNWLYVWQPTFLKVQ